MIRFNKMYENQTVEVATHEELRKYLTMQANTVFVNETNTIVVQSHKVREC